MILKREHSSSKSQLLEVLKEQDAASLGLSVLWVDDYKEIPDLIKEIKPVNHPSSAPK